MHGALCAPGRSLPTASISALFVVPLVRLRGRGRRSSTGERGGGGLGHHERMLGFEVGKYLLIIIGCCFSILTMSILMDQ